MRFTWRLCYKCQTKFWRASFYTGKLEKHLPLHHTITATKSLLSATEWGEQQQLHKLSKKTTKCKRINEPNTLGEPAGRSKEPIGAISHNTGRQTAAHHQTGQNNIAITLLRICVEVLDVRSSGNRQNTIGTYISDVV